MLNPVREGERIEAIRYRCRLKIFENFLLFLPCNNNNNDNDNSLYLLN